VSGHAATVDDWWHLTVSSGGGRKEARASSVREPCFLSGGCTGSYLFRPLYHTPRHATPTINRLCHHGAHPRAALSLSLRRRRPCRHAHLCNGGAYIHHVVLQWTLPSTAYDIPTLPFARTVSPCERRSWQKNNKQTVIPRLTSGLSAIACLVASTRTNYTATSLIPKPTTDAAATYTTLHHT